MSEIKKFKENEITIMKKILGCLVSTHRKEISDIAKELNLSQPTIRKYIQLMEKEKIIWGYTSVGNFEKLGVKTFIILVEYKQDPLANLDKMMVAQTKMSKLVEELGARYVYVGMYHGQSSYQNMGIFYAPNIEIARKVQGLYYKYFGEHIINAHLSEEIISQRVVLQNPDIISDIKNKFGLSFNKEK